MRTTGPTRRTDSGEDRPKLPEPALSDDVTAGQLDAEARRDLRGLQRDLAEKVARHLVAAGTLVDDDPELALEHARYARQRASRIAVVREAAGIAAYHAGEWAEALGELRAARRMGGGPGHIAVMADIERALGRPERALDLARSPEARELGRAEGIELAIVAAGARRDLGELDAAVVGLQVPELDPRLREPWSARLFYAYADNLLAAGRTDEALRWFVHAADADDTGDTDAGSRIAQLTGEPLPEGDEFQFDVEDLVGDAASEAEADEADEAEVEHAEQVEAEQVEAEQVEAEQVEAEQAEVEPVEAEQAEVEPVEAEQAEVEPVEVEQAEVEPVEVEQAEVEPIEVERAEVERAEVEQTEVEQAEVEQAEVEQAEVEPIEAEPVEVGQAEPERATPPEVDPLPSDQPVSVPASTGPSPHGPGADR